MISAKINQYQFIDGMRGIAVLSVLAHHAARNIEVHAVMGSAQMLPDLLHYFLQQGARGVQLFFIVSALTLCLSARGRASETNAHWNFVIRRFFRIAPMFYCAFVLYALLPALRGKLELSLIEVSSTLLFLTGWNSTWMSNPLVPGGWSVAVEMMFYVVFPALFLLLNTWQRALCAIVVSAAFALFAKNIILPGLITNNPDHLGWFAYTWLPAQLPVFLMGFLLYFLLFGPSAVIVEAKMRKTANLWLLASGCVVAFVVAPFVEAGLLEISWLYGLIFLMLVTLSKFGFHTLLSNAFLRFAGKVSFSAYLLHFFVLGMAGKALNFAGAQVLPASVYWLLLSVIGIVVTLAISQLSYKYIEVPSQNVGKRLIERLGRQKMTTAAPQP